jgi:hypothetical protein
MGKLAGIGCLVLLAFAAGCNRQPAKKEPVRGHVYYRGMPLPGGTIVFAPDPDRNSSGPIARGIILSDGSYDLAAGPDQGAVHGWHRVTVASAAPPGSSFSFPLRYTDPEISGQSCEIKAGQTNIINFRLD